MWNFLINISNNLGMGTENIILFVIMLMTLIGYAKDVKLGLILGMIFTGVLFMIFYACSWDYTNSLILFFIHFAILALTILTQGSQSRTGEVA